MIRNNSKQATSIAQEYAQIMSYLNGSMQFNAADLEVHQFTYSLGQVGREPTFEQQLNRNLPRENPANAVPRRIARTIDELVTSSVPLSDIPIQYQDIVGHLRSTFNLNGRTLSPSERLEMISQILGAVSSIQL